jgi:hypothetical protein
MSEYTEPSLNGNTHQDAKAKKKVIMGAKIKIIKLALEGKTVSLMNSFKPSARGCSKPNTPTTLGPFRRCIEAMTLRSAKVM